MQIFLVHAADTDAHARALAERLRWHDCQPTHIWCATAPAALHTADVIARVIECDAPIVTAPLDAALADAIDLLPTLRVVLVVGIEPELSALGVLLAPAYERALRPLAPASAVRIVDHAVRWRIAWDDDAPTPRG